MRDDTTDSGWAPSPGGLVRALLPMLRSSGGTWVGWTGNPDDPTEPFTVDGVDCQPIDISAEEVEAAESALLKTGAYNKIIQTSLLAFLDQNGVLGDAREDDVHTGIRANGDPNGIRTRVAGMKTRCPGPD